MVANQKYVGSSFDDYLAEEGIETEVTSRAAKRVHKMPWYNRVMLVQYRTTSKNLCDNYDQIKGLLKDSHRVIVTDDGGQDEAVMLSAEEYEHLVWAAYACAKLREAEERAKRPGAVRYSKEEFFEKARLGL